MALASAKARSNVANLLRDVLNESVPLREGAGTRQVPSCEAMLRVMVMKACKGDPKALSTIVSLLDMIGRTKEQTEEERERLKLRLPGRAYRTADEFVLMTRPERESDRDRYLAIALAEEGIPNDPDRLSDKNDSMHALYGKKPGSIEAEVRAALAEGDQLTALGEFDQAAKSYRDALSSSRMMLEFDMQVERAHLQLKEATDRLSELARKLLRIRAFDQALNCVDAIIKHSEATPTILIARSIALMFLNRPVEAQAILDGNFGEPQAGARWLRLALVELAELEHHSIGHPAMPAFRDQLITAIGLKSGQVIPIPASSPGGELKASAAQQHESDNVDHSLQPDEDIDAYLRCVIECNTSLQNGVNISRYVDERNRAMIQAGNLIFRLLQAGELSGVIESAERALAIFPTTQIEIYRAHALMLSDNPNAARLVYSKFWRTRANPEQTWADRIRNDFDILRGQDRDHPLMDELQQSTE